MKPNLIGKSRNGQSIERGSVLMSKALCSGELYNQSVVMIINHNEVGTTGVILNKPTICSVNDIIPELEVDNPVYFGGPTNQEVLSIIHKDPLVPDAMKLSDGIFWGGEWEFLYDRLRFWDRNSSSYHLTSGFVTWLNDELAYEIGCRKWVLSNLESMDLFCMPSEELWSHKMLSTGHVYGLFSQVQMPSIN